MRFFDFYLINKVVKLLFFRIYKRLEWRGIMKLLNVKGKKFPFFQRFIKGQNINKCAIVMGGIFQKQKCREGNE